MTPIKRSISFIIEKRPTKKDSTETSPKAKGEQHARVRCVVTWNSQRARLSTSCVVNPEYWLADAQRCRAKSCHGKNKVPAASVNKSLDEIGEMVDEIFRDFERQNIMPTKEEFCSAYKRLTEPEEDTPQTIFPAYDQFIEEGLKCGRWNDSTIKHIRTTRNHLSAMKRDMTFGDLEKIGVGGIIDYYSGIMDNCNDVGLNNRSIIKGISRIRTFLKWAYDHGHCGRLKVMEQSIRLNVAKKPVVFLEWDELMKLYSFDFGGKENLSQVRDVFCFCCFTSLRYSDVYNLKWSNVTDTSISITTVKTHDSLTIELNKYSRAIIDKYRSVTLKDNKVLPVITNQKMNDYLKVIGEMCGFDTIIPVTIYKGTRRIDKEYKKWELLASHAARRTFVCNALMLGIPANIVMKWTGHSDYNAMRPYIDIANSAKRSAMSAFDNVGQKAGQKSGNE